MHTDVQGSHHHAFPFISLQHGCLALGEGGTKGWMLGEAGRVLSSTL